VLTPRRSPGRRREKVSIKPDDLMTHPTARERLESAYQTALAALLAERTPAGHWVGELSTSALSTATAVSALVLVYKARGETDDFSSLIKGGLAWLAEHQNPDGGWGDTVKSLNNISTTMLCRAAFHLTGTAAYYSACLERAQRWLHERYGNTPEQLAEAVRARYGKDRTFSVPILMTSALAGLVSWREVPALPFELACFPQSWFAFLRLPVVSYALPALIAIGQTIFHHRLPRNPVARLVRRLSVGKSLRVLEAIQPTSGGFLEAAPLTSFVTMGLVSSGQAWHPVVGKCVEFLVRSVRPDGSWPIDTNLATWVTTLSVNALASARALDRLDRQEELREWLLRQQYTERHPYTGADPGGWAWTDLPGGVPDGDDTPGMLLALRHLTADRPGSPVSDFIRKSVGTVNLVELEESWSGKHHFIHEGTDVGLSVLRGLSWLLGLQNGDGGWPTFCRGWGTLPFDRSGTDLTAHALRALAAWKDHLLGSRVASTVEEAFNLKVFVNGVRLSFPSLQVIDRAVRKGLAYLARTQRPDGSWLPLWFGNQHAPDDENPTYGTARVLAAYRDLDRMYETPARRAIDWLLRSQGPDGGWGAGPGTPSSMEEAALAVEALLAAGPEAAAAVNKGLAWLVQRVEDGGLHDPTPIGFYFAKLWYFERLYPIIFCVSALGRALLTLPTPS
jgi:squalene-hopene/tetraprenyl-beta-curcumene cyclase